MGRGKGKKKRQNRHTPLKKMKKKGSKLHAPLSEVATQRMSWDRDLLPEHLWIAALAHQFGTRDFHPVFNEVLDRVDEYWGDGATEVCLGLISDFGRLPDDRRSAFVADNRQLLRETVWEPIGPILSLYPESPASWLVEELRENADGAIDPEAGLSRLRGLVDQLLGGRSEFATSVRMLPFGRPLKNGKMSFQADLPILDLLPRYPTGLQAAERGMVESFVRAAMMAVFASRDDLKSNVWAKYFWRHNHDLAVCRPVDRSLPPHQIATDAQDLSALEKAMSEASTQVRQYVDQLRQRVVVDLYDPTRDEILFGLLARVARIFLLMLEEPRLWARDVGSIMLRCLADTAITFAYLARNGTTEDFESFLEYGEGQQKLLMLHLQDHYPEGRSPEGRDVEALEGDLQFIPEFIDIELGHWAKKDARRLAREAGLEKQYRLVYSPSSSDVHGSWLSLKNSVLTYCSEPLHRYHRVPHVSEPPFYVAVVETARQLWQECLDAAVAELGYPDGEPTTPFTEG